MSENPCSLYIPVVQLGAPQGGKLIEVYSNRDHDGDAAAMQAGLDPIAAPLISAGLPIYLAGCVAAGAARHLGLRPPRTALYQHLRPQAWIDQQRLRIVNVAPGIEGPSAELGLALVLLQNASQHRPCPKVIATGSLSDGFQGSRPRDMRIHPVGHLADKLALVHHLLKSGQLEATPQRPIYFFVPDQIHDPETQQLRPTLDDPQCQDLQQQLKAHHTHLLPIAYLSEAVHHLGIDRTKLLPWDHLLRTSLLLLATALTLFGGYRYWQHAPLEMRLLSPQGIDNAAPFQVCPSPIDFIQDNVFYGHFQPLRQESHRSSLPQLPSGGILGWKMRAGQPHSLDGLLHRLGLFDGYHLAQVIVSEQGVANVIIARNANGEPLTLAPGDTWQAAWKLDQQSTTQNLQLLANRRPFDAPTLRDRLEAATATPGTSYSTTAVMDRMEHHATGTIRYTFETFSSETDPCHEATTR